MRERLEDVRLALAFPTEIRRSRADPDIYLSYRFERLSRWVCVIFRRLDGDGFVITAYLADSMKEGESVWPR
jgi:hypothetical protein